MDSERHARRSYDKDGTMLQPATVASTKAHGMKSITATCHSPGCHRSADVSLDGFPDDMAIPAIAPLLKCSGCGGKRITVMTKMREFYAVCPTRGLGVPQDSTLSLTRVVAKAGGLDYYREMAQHITSQTGSAEPTAADRATQGAVLRSAIIAASTVLALLEEMAEVEGVGPDHAIQAQIEEARRDLAEMRIALALLEAQGVRLN